MGMSQEFCDRVMNPDFDLVRLTECACYWALDTIDEAFHYLSVLDQRIQETQHSRDISRVGTQDASVLPRRRQANPPPQRGPPARGPAPLANIASEMAPPLQVERRTMFFKGGTLSRLRSCIAKDGTTVDLRALWSRAPTDFHPLNGFYLYLTKHNEMARQYALFAGARNPSSMSGVLEVAIPERLVAVPREIWGNDWSDLVWLSRKVQLLPLPANMDKYVDSAILVGPVCGNGTHTISRMSDKSQLSMMRLPNGSKGSQWVIQSIERVMEISKECAGFLSVTQI